MNELRAITVVYFGGPVDIEKMRVAISNKLKFLANATGTVIIALSTQDEILEKITKSELERISSCANTTIEKQYKAIPEQYTPAEEAVIYIGTKLANCLGHCYKPEAFVSGLTTLIQNAREDPLSPDSKTLMNALFILSQEDLVVSKSLLKKYYLDEKKILIIKRIYNILKAH